jgi:glycosyltransferase involved in cell wall biosynthesis
MPRFIVQLKKIRSPRDLLRAIGTVQRRLLRPIRRLPQTLRLLAQDLRVAASVRHVCGPRRIDHALDELAVVCLVRDGELYVKSFVEHYLHLGVQHIVLLDNGSTDATATIARHYPRVTILRSQLAFKQYQWRMRHYLIQRFGKDRWVLCVDIDELFDYPGSNRLSMPWFLRYLNTHGYTAVVAQMLDMFADGVLDEQVSNASDSLKETYPYYDISDITQEDYARRYGRYNLASNDAIKFHFGGIRRTLFGTEDWITKHPLVFVDRRIEPIRTGHDVFNARIADISAVLLHYKFLSNFRDFARRAVQEGGYFNNSQAYRAYSQALEREPRLYIRQPTSQRLASINDLVEQGFLVVSPEYVRWVEKHAGVSGQNGYHDHVWTPNQSPQEQTNSL